MFPLIVIDRTVIPTYFIGYILSLLSYIFLCRKFLKGEKWLKLSLISFMFAAVSSKIGVYILSGKKSFLSGDIFWVALAGGGIFTFIYLLIDKGSVKKSLETLDKFTLPICLSYSVYRFFVCFMVGCCYGKPWKYGVSFKPHSAAFERFGNFQLIPTQIIEVFSGFTIFLILYLLRKRLKSEGQPTLIFLFLFSIERFINDFFRGDISSGFYIFRFPKTGEFDIFNGISIWQVAGFVITAIFFIFLWIYRYYRKDRTL